MEWKKTDSMVKKVLGAVVSKEANVDSPLGHERTHYYCFFKEGATVNSTSLCQLFALIYTHI